jgi:hypothetical protein
MASKERLYRVIKKMAAEINLENINSLEQLNSEYDLERALVLDRKLKLMVKEDPSLKSVRDHLRNLIKDYEDRNWSDSDTITEAQLKESDDAEVLVERERAFYANRKALIKERLEKFQLKQQDLVEILDHPKSYISELMNGVRPFSMKDTIIINRVLGIDLDKLVPKFLSSEDRNRLKESLGKFNNPELKLKKEDLMACAL